jgi:hypothetical protein
MSKSMAYKAYSKAKGGKDMSYEDYMKNATEGGLSYMSKGEYEDAEGAGDDEEEEEEEEETEKSEIGAMDLLKAISDYDAVESALIESGSSRESYLRARFDAGTISKSERQEYGRILAGDADEAAAPLRKSMTERIEESDDDASHLVDGSAFLKSLVDSVDSSLDAVTQEVTRDGAATRQLLKAQGGLVRQQAHVILGLSDRLEKSESVIDALAQRLNIVARQPAPMRAIGSHDPRNVRARPLAKSVTGGDALGGTTQSGVDDLSKAQVTQGLRTLVQQAADRDDQQALSVLTQASAKFESGYGLPANVAEAIRQIA